MSRIVESLKRLNVEKDTRPHEQDDEKVDKKAELTPLEDQNYILSVCGTQR